MKTKPFSAIRPAPERAEQLASVPYDVVDSNEARALADGNPYSFLHVSRPEIDLPEGTDIYSDIVYEQAAKALDKLVADGTLVNDAEKAYYAYRQIMDGRAQTGIVACCNIDDYAADVIRKHEKTRQDKEDDRTRHVLTLKANTGPVFLTYRDVPAIDAIVEKASATTPLYDFTAPDGIRHTVWKIADATGETTKLFDAVPVAYVADGHHRAKAAFRAGSELRAADSSPSPDKEYNWFLAVLFPASQLKILPYNRCVKDLNGMSADEFLAKVKTVFDVSENAPASPAGSRNVSMYLGGKWYGLSWKQFTDDPVASLDVSVLQDKLLAPLLGIGDPRTDKRISFIGGIRGTDELENRVNDGRAAVAFSMAPVTIEQMMAIADAGQIMPPKSTWFEPKLRSGLLLHSF